MFIFDLVLNLFWFLFGLLREILHGLLSSIGCGGAIVVRFLHLYYLGFLLPAAGFLPCDM